ncbi:hypothetical protein NDU88_006146 [Pleurodeles waltl]|uniref:Uncharacterized protein n=1 Tax=Pleurodeles waltl TaxID=8319 RepID=A0AAV7WWR1_PLEWA|nr:hypothetical protein NDU88_006146 [Pleurodeles waltl]
MESGALGPLSSSESTERLDNDPCPSGLGEVAARSRQSEEKLLTPGGYQADQERDSVKDTAGWGELTETVVSASMRTGSG